MRKLLFIPFLFLALSSEAAPPSRVSSYTTGTVISSTAVTANEDALFNYLQSGVDSYSDGTIVNADVHSSANIQSDKLNLTAIAQSVANSGSTTLSGTFAANGTTNSIGNGGSDVLTLNVPGGMTLSAATTWTLTGALTFSGTIADLGIVTTADINGGTMDGVQIGGTTATGELLVNDASDDADGLGSQGTSGQYLQSAGAGANPTFVTPLGVLLSTTSFSAAGNSGTISITAGKRYLIFLNVEDISVDMTIQLRFDGDSTNIYAWSNDEITHTTTPTATLTGDDIDSFISMGDFNRIGGDGNGGGLQCHLSLDATAVDYLNSDKDAIMVSGTCIGFEAGGVGMTRDIGGVYKDASTLSSLMFIASTGTFTGTVVLYELN